MTGVIVYMNGDGDGDGDTIGIRLTGENEGMGDHSGSVNGIDYFECPVNSGVLTTTSRVTKRRLTFSEEAMIRKQLLQPKAMSAPVPTSIPMSGLSAAALARMAQLNKRMQVQAPAPAPDTKEPSLKEEAMAPPPSPPKEEKRLSRLDILRQKKEAIRLKKIALQEKVQDKKDKQQLEQPQAEPQAEPQADPVTTATTTAAPTPTTTATLPQDHPMLQQQLQQQQLQRCKLQRLSSRDSLEKLWISELRHESPPAAARYGLDDDDDEKSNHSQVQKQLQQPSLEPKAKAAAAAAAANDNDDDNNDNDEDMQHEQPTTSGYRTLSRVQQLRQKKRLLEALPASININAPAPDAEVRLEEITTATIATIATTTTTATATTGTTTTTTTRATSPTLLLGPNHTNTITMATVASATAVREEDDGQSSLASTISTCTQLSDMDLEDDVHHAVPAAAFQESLTITPATATATATATANPLPPADEEETPGHESLAKPAAPAEQQQQQQQHFASHKRRRMLGLGFLPGNRRLQKRQKGQQQ
jgi:hypothetical protein